MTRSTIYTVDAAGTLTAMRPAELRSEDFMQNLVASHPELIADQDGALLLIRREQPIADREDGNGRWSLDHLFVTRNGVPVLVEPKRAVDTRLRREVIGQMLDYAANGTAYWQGGRIAESFAASMAKQGLDADAVLAAFLGATADPQKFWEQVDANFAAGRIKMVFVADTIPRELARIVEFLNEQMKADIRAVELSWFESDGGSHSPHTACYRRDRARADRKGRTRSAFANRTRHLDKGTNGTLRLRRRRSRRELHNPSGRHGGSGGGDLVASFDYVGFRCTWGSALPVTPIT
jgi:hypothetical protein